MHPILFQIGPLTIYSYGAFLALAFLVATYLAAEHSAKAGISKNYIYDLSIWLLVGGIIGARLGYVIMNLDYYRNNLLEIFFIWHGGLIFYGGLSGALCGSWLYVKRKGDIDYPAFSDIVVPYVALGQSIGRIGCFMNGCCFGKSGQPVQLYESFATLLIFIILNIIRESRHNIKGSLLYLYLALYSIARFYLEFARGDNPALLFGLTLSQIVSIAILSVLIYVSVRVCCSRKR